MGSLRYLNKYFVKYKHKLILGVLFVVLSNIFSLFPAKYIGDAFRIIEEMVGFSNTNEITRNFNNDLLKIVLLIFFAVCIRRHRKAECQWTKCQQKGRNPRSKGSQEQRTRESRKSCSLFAPLSAPWPNQSQ